MSDPTSLARRRFLKRAGAGAAAAAVASTPALSQPASCARDAKRNPHHYEELLPDEFYEEQKRAPIAYFATGAMEEHGLHLAQGTDLYVAYETCLRAAEIAGGIVFPPVPFAIAYAPPGASRAELRSKAKELYAPSLWISGELCRQLYVELLESLADLGFKACIAFGGHGPADSLLQQIEKEMDGRVGAMRFWGGGTVRILKDWLAAEGKKRPEILGHGTMWETSLVMAIRPNWVDLPRAQRIEQSPRPSQLKKATKKRTEAIAQANAELGRQQIELAAQRVAQIARDLLK